MVREKTSSASAAAGHSRSRDSPLATVDSVELQRFLETQRANESSSQLLAAAFGGGGGCVLGRWRWLSITQCQGARGKFLG
jgi:hypothetical protein